MTRKNAKFEYIPFSPGIEQSTVAQMVVCGSSGAILAANQASITLLGVNDLVGREICQIMENFDSSILDPSNTLESRAPYVIPSLKTNPELGQVSTVDLGVGHYSDKSEKRILFTLNDVSKAKEIFERASKLSAIGEMASGIAHEINNPLLVISGRCEIIRVRQEKNKIEIKDYEKAVSLIDRMTTRIEKIVGGLQQFSRDESKDPLEVVRVERIVQEAYELASPRVLKAGIKLDLEFFDHGLSIRCNPIQISQILINLINNAYDALASSDEKWISIQTQICKDQIEVTVRDSGAGLKREASEKLFNPFFTTKPAGQGTGLGLSISKTIAESHGGSLKHLVSDGRTVFVLSIPIAKALNKSA